MSPPAFTLPYGQNAGCPPRPVPPVRARHAAARGTAPVPGRHGRGGSRRATAHPSSLSPRPRKGPATPAGGSFRRAAGTLALPRATVPHDMDQHA